jgi:hypothetical protein
MIRQGLQSSLRACGWGALCLLQQRGLCAQAALNAVTNHHANMLPWHKHPWPPWRTPTSYPALRHC